MQKIEIALLRARLSPDFNNIESPSLADLSRKFIEGSFRDVLTSEPARSVFQVHRSDISIQDSKLTDLFDLSKPSSQNKYETEVLHLILAVTCLQAFVQANWTGPDLDVKPSDLFGSDSNSTSALTNETLNSKAVAELAYGGEPAYHLVQQAAFLRLAQILLEPVYHHFSSVSWWRLRLFKVHQEVLDEPVAIPADMLTSAESLLPVLSSTPDLSGELLLEVGLLQHQLRQDRSAAEYFVQAGRATGLQYELTGALGRRTKFQETDLSQLVLLAQSSLEIDSTQSHGGDATVVFSSQSQLPKALALNDDTLLEQTEFTSSAVNSPGQTSRLANLDPASQPALNPLDQCILLSLCLNVRNTSPSHGLTHEQMMPYVTRVITHPQNWSVHTMALLIRSRLEASRTRTAERSVLQLQALIDQMPTADSTISERLLYFHSIPLPSKWELEKELANRYFSLGVVKSALEIFERLEMWEEVVKCWQSMERQDQAVAIVRDLLDGRKEEAEEVLSKGKEMSSIRRQINDTARIAKLWCLLGDLEPENAVQHYNHAWTVSNETSGRAMRSLGGYYFARGEFTRSIPFLKRAASINPLLSRTWFVLGCAHIREEDWENARDAFGRCVAIDDEDAESWNNLASMYLRIGEKEIQPGNTKENGYDTEDASETSEDNANAKGVLFSNKILAFRALKQGLRFAYDNWRMWTNYMIVSMDVGELSETCRAVGRIVEERSSKDGADCVDEDVLERLVDAVTRAPSNPDDAVEGEGKAEAAVRNPNEGHGLLRRVNDLFERTILPRISSERIFRAYARLLTWQGRWEDAVKAYLDGYRCSAAGTIERGESNVKKWREAVREVEDIVGVLMNFGPRVDGSKWRLQARSVLRTFMGRTRDFEDEPEWSQLTRLQDELRDGD